jgi:hypothetical protein
MIEHSLPRFVQVKTLSGGQQAFYWVVTGHYRKLGCTIPNETLGCDYQKTERARTSPRAPGRAADAVQVEGA